MGFMLICHKFLSSFKLHLVFSAVRKENNVCLFMKFVNFFCDESHLKAHEKYKFVLNFHQHMYVG